MKKKNILTTGEFARLCKTTKETLFHYDRIGLLKPKHLSENGYRYYGMEQFFDFDMIATLKDTGSSLKEIMAYMRDMDGGNFLSLLEDKLRIVKNERARLIQREMMLRDMVEGTREALGFAYDTFTLSRQEEERLEILPTVGLVEESMEDFIERFAKYIDFYNKQKRVPHRPFGAILNIEDMITGKYMERYYFSRATRSTPLSMLHIKPKGRYAVLAHTGTLQSHLQIVCAFMQQIEDMGLIMFGYFYYYDLMSYVLMGSCERYAAKYCVLVK